MQNENYYSKYIKYKNKYLELKNIINNQKGNGETINCALVAHNGRIKCLLTSLGIPIKKFINEKNKEYEMRFKNCAIILLKITSQKIEISLIYDGEINKIKKDYFYYVKDTTNMEKNEIKFENFVLQNEKYSEGLRKLNLKPDDINDNTINFYMVRHGEGEHNVASLSEKLVSNKILDASLTDIGKTQALNASAKLNTIKFDYCFVSDLRRTRQTIEGILENNDYLEQITQIYVLPCSHELDFKSSGNCDGAQLFSMIEKENQMKCEPETDSCRIDDEKVCCIVKIKSKAIGKIIPLNWTYYRQFYAGGTRKRPGNSRLHCRDTNMISLGVFVIDNSKLEQPNLSNMSNWITNRKN
jgi:broad specificity phosphatase PhoE